MIIVIAAAAGLSVIIFVSLLLTRGHHNSGKSAADNLEAAAKVNAEHVFDDKFREELRNRGRLHFEKIISENAMFLQQDLRLTTSQLNDFMKAEITKKLQDEFALYEQAINDAKEVAVESITKTNQVIDEQRRVLGSEVSKQLADEKAHLINRFEEGMADIVNHYVVAAIGNQIDLSDQLEYIMGELEANKAAIAEDIKNGA